MSGQDDYKRQREKVIDLKRKNEGIPPIELYKLAGLLQRWAVTDKLPVCLLCQDSNKKIKQLGHIIPHSMVKLDKNIRYYDMARGASSSVSKFAYFVFCEDCEKRFQMGEHKINPEFFEQFFSNPEEKIEIKAKMGIKGEGGPLLSWTIPFPWLYYSLISIVWRNLAINPDSCNFIEPLEVMRKFLLNWNTNTAEVDQKIKLFLYAPNEAVKEKLQDRQENLFIFHEFFSTRFFEVSHNRNRYRYGYIFLGPLHVFFDYSQPLPPNVIIEHVPNFAGQNCMLTPETVTFVIDDCKSRYFPDNVFDTYCKFAAALNSERARFPEGSKKATENCPTIEGQFLHLLPKDVSYEQGKFDFPSSIYKHVFDVKIDKMHIIGVMIGNKRGLFVLFLHGVGRDKDLAVGLLVQGDNTVTYMRGVNIPENINDKDTKRPINLKIPLYKDEIEYHLRDSLLQRFNDAQE